jgi:acyl dehydratase
VAPDGLGEIEIDQGIPAEHHKGVVKEALKGLNFLDSSGRTQRFADQFTIFNPSFEAVGNLDTKAPVFVGDTLEVWVEVTAARMTSRGDRGVVTTRNEVRNQRGELVMVFTPSRMIKNLEA